MAQNQIHKLLRDLNNPSDKLKILALMFVSRLTSLQDSSHESLKELFDLIEKHAKSQNPDISFLAKKAKNHLTGLNPDLKKNLQGPVNADDSTNLLLKLRSADLSMEELEKALNHEDERILSAAIEACKNHQSAAYIQKHLSRFLTHESNRIRADCVIAIGKENLNSVLSHLKSMLNTTRISMRESAVFAISALPPHPELKSLLLKCLHDPYRDIRLRAIDALRSYPQKDVILQLERLCEDLDRSICEKATEILGALKANPPHSLSMQEEEPEEFDEFLDYEPEPCADTIHEPDTSEPVSEIPDFDEPKQPLPLFDDSFPTTSEFETVLPQTKREHTNQLISEKSASDFTKPPSDNTFFSESEKRLQRDLKEDSLKTVLKRLCKKSSAVNPEKIKTLLHLVTPASVKINPDYSRLRLWFSQNSVPPSWHEEEPHPSQPKSPQEIRQEIDKILSHAGILVLKARTEGKNLSAELDLRAQRILDARKRLAFLKEEKKLTQEQFQLHQKRIQEEISTLGRSAIQISPKGVSLEGIEPLRRSLQTLVTLLRA